MGNSRRRTVTAKIAETVLITTTEIANNEAIETAETAQMIALETAQKIALETAETAKQALKDKNRIKRETAAANHATAKIAAFESANEVFTIAPEIGKRVTLAFSISQPGKNPCTIEHTVTCPAQLVEISSLTRKMSFAVANSLYDQCALALDRFKKHGKYITAFRPKSPFLITAKVNGKIALFAHETKGADSIRVMNGKGELIPRGQIVDQFELISGMVKASRIFAEALSFDAEIANLEANLSDETATV